MKSILTTQFCRNQFRPAQASGLQIAEEWCETHQRVDCEGEYVYQCDCIDKVIEAFKCSKEQLLAASNLCAIDDHGSHSLLLLMAKMQEEMLNKLQELAGGK